MSRALRKWIYGLVSRAKTDQPKHLLNMTAFAPRPVDSQKIDRYLIRTTRPWSDCVAVQAVLCWTHKPGRTFLIRLLLCHQPPLNTSKETFIWLLPDSPSRILRLRRGCSCHSKKVYYNKSLSFRYNFVWYSLKIQLIVKTNTCKTKRIIWNDIKLRILGRSCSVSK